MKYLLIFALATILIFLNIYISHENIHAYITAALTLLGIGVPVVIGIKNLKTQIHANSENLRREFLLQKRYQDTKDNLPVLLEILEDLHVLQQAFVFRGVFCPPLEHRAPNLSEKDGTGLDMSYAQRTHQFYLVGLRIIKNCRKIIFLTPCTSLPETLKMCKELKNFLSSREEGKKTHLDFMTTTLTSYLGGQSKDMRTGDLCTQFHTKLQLFQDTLDSQIEKELPYLTEE